MNNLHGKTILVTRPREQSEEFEKLLHAQGAKCIVFPTIEIVPPESWNECDAAIEKLDSYHAIVFASLNAVDSFFSRLNEHKIHILKNHPVYVVGEKTYSAVVQHGITPVSPPDVHDGRHLAEKLVTSGVKGKRFLLPKGNLGRATVREELLKHGAVVDEVIVYRTVAPSNSGVDTLKRMFQQKEIDAITFFSPSSIENFLSVIPSAMLSRTAIAVIGKTTAEAAAHWGLTVDVIANPSTSEGLVNALQKFFIH